MSSIVGEMNIKSVGKESLTTVDSSNCPACTYRAQHNDKAMYITTCKECIKTMRGNMSSYHTLLPQHLQDVLKNVVNKKRGKSDRLTDIQYIARIDKAIAKVAKSFPQAFIKKG